MEVEDHPPYEEIKETHIELNKVDLERVMTSGNRFSTNPYSDLAYELLEEVKEDEV